MVVQPAWNNHFSAFGAQDVEKILADYTEESEIRVFNTATSETAVHKGLGAVRECFVGLFKQLSDLGDLGAPVAEVQEAPRNQVFLVWSCKASGVQRATDTFTFDGAGKIVNQNIMITIEGVPAPAAPPAPIDEHVAGGTVKAAWDNHFSAFGAQDVDKILADYTEESEIRVWDHRTQQMNLYTGLTGVRDCFEGLFSTLSDLSALAAPVQVVQEAPRNQVFLQWSCPSSGILEATDTFTFDASGKIKNQNVALMTAPTSECEAGAEGQLATAELVGRRIRICGHGDGTVLRASKGVFGLGATKHVVKLDSGAEIKLKLLRHSNGGTSFDVLSTMVTADAGADGGVVRFGVAGTSEIGPKVIPALRDCTLSTVVAVGSRDAGRAAEYAGKHSAGDGVTYDELLGRDDVDAVYVPFPTKYRNEFLRKAIAAGKHIYSEKPLGGSVPELRELIDACAAANLQWMDGTMWYHSKRTRAIEQRLWSGELGRVQRVTASFTFVAPDEAWLQGGNNRTNKDKEPHGCLGDMGHYPISAIMWAFDWELPERVQTMYTKTNKVDTIIALEAALFWPDGRRATLDIGADCAHRSQFEISTNTHVIKVDDLVGGQGRSGDFSAYFVPFEGSREYVLGDAGGKDETVQVEPSDHVALKVEELSRCILKIKQGGKPDAEWPKRSLATHAIMCAIFESSQREGEIVRLAADGTSYALQPHPHPGSDGFLDMLGKYPGRSPTSGGPRVQHNVMFAMKAGKDDAVNWFEETLKPSVQKLSGVIAWNYGPYDSFEGFNKNFNWGMSFTFKDQYSRDVWIAHREHEAGIGSLMPLLENGADSVVAFDHLLPEQDLVSTVGPGAALVTAESDGSMPHAHPDPGSEGFLDMLGKYPGRSPTSGGPRVQHNVMFAMKAGKGLARSCPCWRMVRTQWLRSTTCCPSRILCPPATMSDGSVRFISNQHTFAQR
jgi:D-xylose 1-dehydrogenase (NADP+, D-xylono-1,5-lactone-forming)